jgi:iron complex transport system permease protein
MVTTAHETVSHVLFRHQRVRVLGLAVAAAVLMSLVLASVAIGAKSIPLSGVIRAVTDEDPARTNDLIVHTLRIPRTVLAVVVGAALGLAGAVMQGVVRNPLADPGILGINAGAALFVVLAISALGITSVTGYIWFAFAGAAVAAVVVYLLGSIGRGGATPVKLALSGAAITAFLGAITTAVLLLDVVALDRFRFWDVGSVVGRDLEGVLPLLPFFVLGAALALATGPLLNTLALGDDVAEGLGQRVGLSRAFSAVAIVLLCGSATAAAGPIAFIGLTVPHMARLVTGPDYRWILPYSALLGASLLLVADIVGRVVARPGEIEVGVVTAIIGAPVFIYLVRRRKLPEI